ncbi:suppressor of cytokine signaling 3-like isoform 1-T2 [Polymixia lowei]
MVTHSRRNPPAMSSVTPPENRGQGSNLPPHRYKPFSSHAHYLQVMCALRKLHESGFYWGAVGGREASSLLRSEPPGTFLVRDSSDHHHFFTLSVQTARGTKNLRIHSEGGGFFLQPDPRSTHEPPRFDCVLKLIAHYMGKGPDAVGEREGAASGQAGGTGAKGGSVYLIHTGGERVPLELRRPLSSSLSSLQHLCRRTLNNRRGPGGSEHTEQLPHTLRDFLEEYDAPI